jgi:uncharacterized protein DUF2019
LPDDRLIGDLVFYRRVRGKETWMGSLVEELRAEYRALAVEWGEARDSPERANRLFKAHHALYRQIRESAAGREAITGLLDDPVTAVRVLAATHSLAWESSRAVRALEDIEQEDGLYAVDAKWTLRSYRNGKLDLDW